MRKLGVVCIILGAALLGAALFLLRMNRQEDQVAQEAAVTVLPQLVQEVQEKTAQEPQITDDDLLIPVELLTQEQLEMTEVVIDGQAYIGYLSIPKLELELPIISQWSYPKMRIAPCRYYGNLRSEDLVLVAHNYNSHFGKISQLELLDTLSFTDVDGHVTVYQVVGKDVLAPTAVAEMTSGAYDLTLFTCTYGGGSRITVYCDKLA